MASFNALTQYTETPAVKTLDLSSAGTEKLIAFGEGQRQRYLNNSPFPHLVIDNLFPTALLEDVLKDVTNVDVGPTASRFLLDLCSARFCLFLEALTGIEGIIPDPHFEGGGVHEMAQGDFLKMHTDFSWSKKLKLDRRLNMLIYLNDGWQDSWGGHLELWDGEMKNQCVKVPPTFNKTVIFSTTDRSYYGLPHPLACPEDRRRRSLALYYYSNDRPAHEVDFHQDTGTPYQARPGEVFLPHQKAARSATPSMAHASGHVIGRAKNGQKIANVPASARLVTAQVKKKIKKSLPKPLLALYRAGKRSLRG